MQSRDRQSRPVSLLQQLRCLDLQSVSQGFEGVHGGRILLALDHADVVAVEPGEIGELLLGEPAFPPQAFKIPSQGPPESHELQRSPSLSEPPPSILGFCSLLIARFVVASPESAGGWQIGLDEGADAYVATLRSPDVHEPHLVVRLPRRTIDDAVFAAAAVTLEVTPEGRVAAYTESSGARTLIAAALHTLIAQAVAPASLSAEEASGVVDRLEAELVRALDAVRQARHS